MSANLDTVMSAQKHPAPQVSTQLHEDDLEKRNKSQAHLAILAVLLSILFLADAVL
ncbi:hypothetical protein GV827_06990 [Sulfitobacter sp. JBTF-M27]|uniref:Uncharacterized protein n=1 Tax=Sulfitobacter sediminilitoris TaxID=2698830 RepID=A0A6P0CCP0_9RHOB|nr:hypothetical protein [Sulfitobacter sediminilitoris]NEK22144.1 hypothetical protein [Sulfitobacter sediminilitoris]